MFEQHIIVMPHIKKAPGLTCRSECMSKLLFISYLPQSKDVHVGPIGDSNFAVKISMNVFLMYPTSFFGTPTRDPLRRAESKGQRDYS